jgi:hypothetical protein
MKPSLITHTIDWQAVERDYRAGVMSLREMASLHGVAHSAIDKRAKRDGWTRDLKARIQAKAQELVNRQVVNRSENMYTEVQIVDSNATVVAGVQINQRKDIGRSRALSMRLLEELEAQTSQVPELVQLGELMRSPDERGSDKLNDLYQKIISLPVRTKTMKDLSDTLKTLIALEREAYSIGQTPEEAAATGLAAFFTGLKRSALPVIHAVEGDDEH